MMARNEGGNLLFFNIITQWYVHTWYPTTTMGYSCGADLRVFEHESAEAMEKEASQVAPDGDSIGISDLDLTSYTFTKHVHACYGSCYVS